MSVERAVIPVDDLDAATGDAAPARPAHWGGYTIRPASIEFWQGRDGRLHDRFRFERTGDGWAVVRLAP